MWAILVSPEEGKVQETSGSRTWESDETDSSSATCMCSLRSCRRGAWRKRLSSSALPSPPCRKRSPTSKTVTAWAHSKWAGRRKIDLAELIDEPWILTGPTAWSRPLGEEVFRAAGLSRPNARIATDSIILGARLIAGSPYLGMFASSVLRRLITDDYALAALTVDLRANAFSTGIFTL
jgi:hypothetical protein